MRETMTLGEVPIRVIRPPSSEPKAIGISRLDGEVPVRRASWNAIGIMIARAPTFLTKADSSVTTPTSTRICRCTVTRCGASGAINRSAMPDLATAALTSRAVGDDHDDIVAEAGEGLVGRDDAGSDRGEQRQHGDQVVAQPPPDEEGHHRGDDGEGEGLGRTSCGSILRTGQLALAGPMRGVKDAFITQLKPSEGQWQILVWTAAARCDP